MDRTLSCFVNQDRQRFTDMYADFAAINRQYAFRCHETLVTADVVFQHFTAEPYDDTLFALAQRTGHETALQTLIDAVVTAVNGRHATPRLPDPDVIFGHPEACRRHQSTLETLAASLLETYLIPLAEFGYYDHGRGAVLMHQQAPWTPWRLRYVSEETLRQCVVPSLTAQLAPFVTTYAPHRQAVVGMRSGPWLWGEITHACRLDYPLMPASPRRLTIYEAWVAFYLPDILSCAAASEAHRRRGVVLIRPRDDASGQYELGWLDTSRYPPDPASDLATWVKTYTPTQELVILAVRHWATAGSRWGTGAVLLLDLETAQLRQLQTAGTPRGPAVLLPQTALW